MDLLRSQLADPLSGKRYALPGLNMNAPRHFQFGASWPTGSTPLRRFTFTALLLGILTLGNTLILRSQEEIRSRIPVVGKIGAGTTHQAFSGKVQSLDLAKNLLKVGTVEGNTTEFFPIKKTVQVSNANGGRMRVKDLTPGTLILVYFDQKDDRRTVSQIMVLTPGRTEEKKKAPPPS